MGFGCVTKILPLPDAMPTRTERTPSLACLSPVAGKPIIARFDGGALSSDGGLLALPDTNGPVRRPVPWY